MRFKAKFTALTGSMALVIFSSIGVADDTDIYIGGTPPPGTEPLVMFSLDWRPNLGSPACDGTDCDFLIAGGYLPATGPYTYFDLLRAVLRNVMDPLEGLQVGLMLSHDYQNNCANNVSSGCSNGGFIALGARAFQKDDANGAKARFHQYLADIPTPQGAASHKYQGKELFFELYRYLTGQGVYNGHVGFTDFLSANDTNMDIDTPEIMWDTSVESGGNYISPLTGAGACTKIFTLNLMFQVTQQDHNSDAALGAAVPSGMGFGNASMTFPDVVEWLNDVDLADGTYAPAVPDLSGVQNVISYFIVSPSKINQTTTSYATAGGTGAPLALSEDPEELIRTLTEVFQQIIGVSTTFVAASVPVNTFNRAEIIDNVYIALFRPAGNPVWTGNVKKLRISGLAAGIPVLSDANGSPAMASDGRIRYDALTYWTDPATLPAPDADKGEIAGADGRSATRGGVGQMIPGYVSGAPGHTNAAAGGRTLYYDNGGTLAALDDDPVTAGALQGVLGASSVAEAGELIAYARGMDIDDLDSDSIFDEARDWIHGAPLHSRPLPLNFGARGGYSDTNPAIYVAVASNDGFIRMIRNTNIDGSESGAEVWGFMPQLVMGELDTLRTNATSVKHPYLVDGVASSYLEDANANGTIDSGEKAYMFSGLRRGGKAYYALNIGDPESPQLMWGGPLTKAGDFSELGLTFSMPRVIITEAGGVKRPALVFGGGFDINKDTRGGIGTDDTEGNAIYVVDMETGNLIWKAVGSGTAANDTFVHAAMVDSIPSDITTLDSDGDGVHDRLYVGDTGGTVWRADINGDDTGNWKVTTLAKLGRHASTAGTKVEDRRFFHRPDIVQTFDGDTRFDAVIIGSGDRPDPLDKGGLATNWAFMIRDVHTGAGAGVDSSIEIGDLGDITNTCLDVNSTCTADLSEGWALRMKTPGEKILSKPLTIANTVYFTSYVPGGAGTGQSCGPSEGGGRLYAVSLRSGSAVNDYDTTSPDDYERFVDLRSGGIPADIVSIPDQWVLRPDGEFETTNASTRFEAYWFEAEDTDL